MDLSAPWPRLELRAPPALPARSSSRGEELKFFTTSALNCFEWPFAETRLLLPGATRGVFATTGARDGVPVAPGSRTATVPPPPSPLPAKGEGQSSLGGFGFGNQKTAGGDRVVNPPRPHGRAPGRGHATHGGGLPARPVGHGGPEPAEPGHGGGAGGAEPRGADRPGEEADGERGHGGAPTHSRSALRARPAPPRGG